MELAETETEANLVQFLEEKDEITKTGRKQAIAKNGGRRWRGADRRMHDKLPFLMKQMSTKKVTNSFDTDDDDDDDKHEKAKNKLFENDQEEQQKSLHFDTFNKEKKTNHKNYFAYTNNANHQRTTSSTERFFDYLSTAEFGTGFITDAGSNREKYSHIPLLTIFDDDYCKGNSERSSIKEKPVMIPDVESPLLGNNRNKPKRRCSCAPIITAIAEAIGLWNVIENTKRFLFWTVSCLIIPLLLIAAVLFYFLNNPLIAKGHVAISWCLIFIVRQIVTFHLAKCLDYIVHVLAFSTNVFLNIFGPVVTMVLVQANGRPLILASWGLFNFILNHGSGKFTKNWLFFLQIPMFSNTCSQLNGNKVDYSSCNPDHGVLETPFYSRLLFSMIIMGLATIAARTAVALYNGRRMLTNYRPKLEALLYDMDLIAEVAELSAETEREGFDFLLANELGAKVATKGNNNLIKERIPTLHKKSPERDRNCDDDDDDDDEDNDNDDAQGATSNEDDISSNDEKKKDNAHQVSWSDLKCRATLEKSLFAREESNSSSAVEKTTTSRLQDVRKARMSSSMHQTSWGGREIEKLQSQLVSWQEPDDIESKNASFSIYEIMKIKMAVDFLRKGNPFTAAFGPAHTRKACIKSSRRIYKRLLKFVPPQQQSSSEGQSTTTPILPFDVLGALAYDENEKLIEDKARALLGIFLPDKDDKLPEVAFVQSIDYVYKRYRFLRAAILNANSVDSVIEDMFNAVFHTIMLMIIIGILGWDPWPMLVSFSTLLVSFAFALGPSAGKYIEGVLQIAIGRPYDIGDRITISDATSPNEPIGPDSGRTWFVQDITLAKTTLRFATTNEVSIMNNYVLSSARIVNCSKSIKAIVSVDIKFLLEKATPENVNLFRSKVNAYLKDRPRSWGTNGLLHFRTHDINPLDGYVEYKLRAQHVKSWQDAAHILVQKGELFRKCVDMAKNLGILFYAANDEIDVNLKGLPSQVDGLWKTEHHKTP